MMTTKAENPTSSTSSSSSPPPPPPRHRSRGPDRLRRPRLFVVVFAATALVLSPAIVVVVVDAFAVAGGRCHRPRRPFVGADAAASFRSPERALPPKTTTTTTALRGFLDGIFGGGGDDDDDDAVEKIDGAVLATYDTAVDVDIDDIDTRFESLSDYVTEKWIGLFEAGTISLTTPVKVSRTYDDENNEDDAAVDDSAGCRLLFQKANTGYDDDDENDENDENGNGKKKDDDEPKQGGVEIVVRKLSKDGLLRVVARRCEIDEGTLVKEMSEEIILKELAKAIDVWKKEEAA